MRTAETSDRVDGERLKGVPDGDRSGAVISLGMYTINSGGEAFCSLEEIANLVESIEELRDSLPSLIRGVLSNSELDISAKEAAISCISSAPEAEIPALIQEVLSNSELDIFAKKAAISYIPSAPEAEIPALIQKVLNDPGLSPSAKEAAISCISSAPEAEIPALIQEVLSNPGLSPYAKEAAISCISSAPEAEQAELRELILPLIQEVLSNPELDIFAKKLAISYIPSAPEAEIPALIQKVLNDPGLTISTKKAAISYIPSVPEAKQAELRELATTLGLSQYVIQLAAKSSLHHLAKPGKKVEQTKTGSGTIILPKEEEASVRYIPVSALFAWWRAYSEPSAWKDAGFDYVPVETITELEEVEDATGLTIGIRTNLLRGGNLKKTTSLYSVEVQAEITRLRDKIIETLSRLGVAHGHLHDGNFVLVSEVDEQGQPLPSETPRIYVIDFDQAIITDKAA